MRLLMSMVLVSIIFIFSGCQTDPVVTDFQSCADAGYPVNMINPPQCVANGITFVKELDVTDFDSCAAAGNPIMESYPRQCSADGKTYTEEISVADRCLGGTYVPEADECEYISEEACSELGGVFDECASACRNDPEAVICTMQCIPVCSLSPLGGDRDEHGCIPSAGYTWCEAKQECLREWEEPCVGSSLKDLCEAAGGNYNECSSRCAIDNQGKEDVACDLMCEGLCECGGIAGFSCPEGYSCVMPDGVADAMGYCVEE